MILFIFRFALNPTLNVLNELQVKQSGEDIIYQSIKLTLFDSNRLFDNFVGLYCLIIFNIWYYILYP